MRGHPTTPPATEPRAPCQNLPILLVLHESLRESTLNRGIMQVDLKRGACRGHGGDDRAPAQHCDGLRQGRLPTLVSVCSTHNDAPHEVHQPVRLWWSSLNERLLPGHGARRRRAHGVRRAAAPHGGPRFALLPDGESLYKTRVALQDPLLPNRYNIPSCPTVLPTARPSVASSLPSRARAPLRCRSRAYAATCRAARRSAAPRCSRPWPRSRRRRRAPEGAAEGRGVST